MYITLYNYSIFFFFNFCPHHMACGILVPQPDIKLALPPLAAQSLITTREVPIGYFHLHSLRLFSQPSCVVGIIILPSVQCGDRGLERLSHSQVIDIAVN